MTKTDLNDTREHHDIPSAKPSYLLKGFMLSAIVSGYILGPLLVLGGGSWWLYKHDYISKVTVILAVVIASVISNALIILRSRKMVEQFNKKTGIKDPTAHQVEQWKKNKPASYKYSDDEEEED